MPATLAVPVSDATLADLRREAADTGSTPEQVAAARLVTPPILPPAVTDWLALAAAHRERLRAEGVAVHNTTPEIAAERRRDG